MKPVIAFTIGDINGIGPEIILRSVSSQSVASICRPVLVGPWSAFEYYARKLRLRLPPLVVSEPPAQRPPVPRPGRPLVTSGRIAAASLRHAVVLATRGFADAIVTAPVAKTVMKKAGLRFPGQTEYLQHLTGSPRAGMMLVAGAFRVGLITIHIPVNQISRVLNSALLKERIALYHEALRHDWGIRHPKLAVLGLNPHAGESGLLGKEEQEIIIPTLKQLKRRGVNIAGPFPADAFFARRKQRGFDAVIAMYHDQGLIPLKMEAAGHGVNVTAGLPVIRTSPDHGTGFDIAGRGTADHGSMIAAVRAAVHIFRQRR
ncbi:MAG: 4-hydroxythreonine-4-phosphate dehydrogenase PdxA [Ignavibacteria bacterium]|nr:4-hydroxythreonine-4-phosphate dehydrogenase PdxA [Ignavibacteria bacterium]